MLQIVFFKTENGKEPVREWLKDSLSISERKIIGNDLKTVQYGWPLGMPLVGSLGDSLWEVRSHLEGRIARLIFFMWDNHMVLLHAFIKKTQKIPKDDLDLAKKRKNLFLSDV